MSNVNENLENEFFNEKFYFSYSSLQKLRNDPQEFYKNYILQDWDDIDTKILKEGQLFHCFILEPQNFDDKFLVSTGKLPTAGLKSVVDEVYKKYVKHKVEENTDLIGTFHLSSYESQILNILEEIDLYQTLTDASRKNKDGVILTGDQKRMAKVLTHEAKDYFLMLQEGEKRTVVDMDMVVKAKTKAEIVIQNTQVKAWLTPDNIKIDVRKELELKSDIPNYNFGLKGFIDLVEIDMENETITIVDFKTTSKTLKAWYEDFVGSKYLYWMQPIIYKELIMSLVPEDSKYAWKLKVFYPVIDKNNSVYIFPVKTESLAAWEVMTKNALDIAKWHMETKEFDLPYEFAKGTISL
jgi:hypothetical protein